MSPPKGDGHKNLVTTLRQCNKHLNNMPPDEETAVLAGMPTQTIIGIDSLDPVIVVRPKPIVAKIITTTPH